MLDNKSRPIAIIIIIISIKNYFPHQMQNSIPLRLLLGFLSGSLSCSVNIAFDVAKSRIQGPQPILQYHGAFSTIHLVWKHEG